MSLDLAFWARALVSGLVIALASTIARRQPAFGALIVSLPLVSVLSMIWLWRDGAPPADVARYIQSTFWYFLPTMPMFLVMPWLLRRGIAFWPTLAAGCLLTISLFAAMTFAARRMGLEI